MSAFVLTNFISSGEGVVHFFGTRTDPADLFSTVKVGQLTEGTPEYPRIASLTQVHGTDVRVFDRPSQVESQGLPPGDALVTNQPNLLVLVRTADCVPILVADMKRRVIAAIHAGWRGTLSGIVSKTLSVLQTQFDSRVDDLRVGIGPSIGVCCFEVDGPVMQPLQATVPFWEDVVEQAGAADKAMLNLKKLIARQLAQCGIVETAISQVDSCTKCDPEMFYSYRREGRVNGTMMSGIMLNR